MAATVPATQCAPDANYRAAATPVAFWSTEARCAIVPAGPAAAFGPENFGNKFPGEAAVFMGIVHVAMFDAMVAIDGRYRSFAPTPTARRGASPESAIASAAYLTLVGLQNTNKLRLSPTGVAILNADHAAYLEAIPDDQSKLDGITVGAQAAQGALAMRTNDGLDTDPRLSDLFPPAPGPGIWQPSPTTPVLGLRLPGVRPIGFSSPSRFRPDGPNALSSDEYANDLNQVKAIGRVDSTVRTAAQTDQARFWTDHDIRQWNDGMLRLAEARGLDDLETARLLAMAHVAGGDAMIACFDAKYHYWFWRPYQAIRMANSDGNLDTIADPEWQPLGATPNFPEYPSAHACHSSAVVTALTAFFGTDTVAVTLDSRAAGVSDKMRRYQRLRDVVKDVNLARVLVGFHFRNSDLQGSNLGRAVSRYDTSRLFQPVG